MSETKFGFVMPQGWRWLDQNGCSPVEQYCFVKDIVNSAEHLGYDTAYSFDHLMGGANYRYNRKKPALLAKMGSTIDTISERRIELGIGAGWDADEYLAFSYDQAPLKGFDT